MNVNDNDLIVSLKVKDLNEIIENLLKDKKKSMESNVLIPLKQCCKIFNVSLTTIHKWKRLGILPKVVKIGGRCYFDQLELREVIEKSKC